MLPLSTELRSPAGALLLEYRWAARDRLVAGHSNWGSVLDRCRVGGTVVATSRGLGAVHGRPAGLASWAWDVLDWLKARWTYPRTGYAPGPLRPEEEREMRREGLSIDPAASEDRKARFQLWAPHYRTAGRAWCLAGLLLAAMDFLPFRWAPCLLATASALALWRARGYPDGFSFRPVVLASLPLAGFLISFG